MKTYLILYVPTIHRGYTEFVRRHETEVTSIYVLDKELIERHRSLQKDVRILSPPDAQKFLETLTRRSVILLTDQIARELSTTDSKFIMPDEDVSHWLKDTYFRNNGVYFEPVMLRWDRILTESLSDVHFDRTVSFEELRPILRHAVDAAEQSTNWWRQVGVVAWKDQKILGVSRNLVASGVYAMEFGGDPRTNASRGSGIGGTLEIHAEALLIAKSASGKGGLRSADVFVTTFPCSPCAKLLAFAGIKTLYFGSGYASIDGVDVFRARGIDIVHVTGMPEIVPRHTSPVSYPEKKEDPAP